MPEAKSPFYSKPEMPKRRNKTRSEGLRGFAPFRDVPPEEYHAAMKQAGEEAGAEYERELANLRNLLAGQRAPEMISTIVRYGFYGEVDAAGKWIRVPEEREVMQCEVELLLALSLLPPPAAAAPAPPDPEAVPKIQKSLRAVMRSFARRRFAAADHSKSAEEKATVTIQEWARLNTQFTRSNSSLGQLVRMASGVYAPLDASLSAEIGISASELISVFHSLVGTIQQRVNRQQDVLREVFSAPTREEAARRFCEMEGFDAKDTEETLRCVETRCATAKDAHRFFFLYSLHILERLHTFSPDEVAKEARIAEEKARTALQLLCVKPGDIDPEHVDRLLLDNPVWTRPVVAIGTRFYCPLPQLFFSSVHEILDGLVSETLRTKLQDRRAEYLETRICELFVRHIPGSTVVSGVKWTEDGKEYETDLICRIDSYIIVVEAKSGGVSAPALRGAPKSLRTHIGELLVEPSRQSARLAERIRAVFEGKETADFFVDAKGLSLDGVHRVLRLSITLDEFASLQTQIRQLPATGLIPNDVELAPTMTVADLESVFDLLGSATERIHYLERRATIDRNLIVTGTEMDWLGYYLKYGFVIGQAEAEKSIFVISGNSKVVDEYYCAVDLGLSAEKPVRPLTRWWRDIVAAMESRRIPRWTEGASMMLNFRFEDQKRLEKEFRRMLRKARSKGRAPSENAIVHVPFLGSLDAVAVLAIADSQFPERHVIADELANRAFERTKASQLLILARRIEHDDYPYGMLKLAATLPANPPDPGCPDAAPGPSATVEIGKTPVHAFTLRCRPAGNNRVYHSWQSAQLTFLVAHASAEGASGALSRLLTQHRWILVETLGRGIVDADQARKAGGDAQATYELALARGYWMRVEPDHFGAGKDGIVPSCPPRLDESFVDKVVARAGGRRLTDEERNHDKTRNADYRLDDYLIELKDLQEEGMEKPERQRKLAELFLRYFPNEPEIVIDPRVLSKEDLRSYSDILGSPVRERVKDAARQIKATRLHLGNPTLKGGVIVLNSGFYSLPTPALESLVQRSAGEITNQLGLAVCMTARFTTDGMEHTADYRFFPPESDNVAEARLGEEFGRAVGELMTEWGRAGFPDSERSAPIASILSFAHAGRTFRYFPPGLAPPWRP